LLVGLRDLASKYETGIHIHLQETIYQKLYGLRTWNKTPLQHLKDLDFLGSDVVCGHGVWVTDEDIETMASHRVSLCHNASSNLRLKSGIAPVNHFLDKGLRIALGSDEAGLNDDKDMVQEMRLALNIHRVPGVGKTSPTAHQIFQMATVNGAYATCFGDRVGTLKVGKRADIVLMNLENIEKPYLNPEVSIIDAVVHRGRSEDIDTVLVEGEVIMRGRKLTQIDEEILYKEVENMMSRPPTEDELDRRDLAEKVEPYLGDFLEGALPSSDQAHDYYNAKY
jgi:cytosine/adenosine deaminase-related metal-dependent hydrolase